MTETHVVLCEDLGESFLGTVTMRISGNIISGVVHREDAYVSEIDL